MAESNVSQLKKRSSAREIQKNQRMGFVRVHSSFAGTGGEAELALRHSVENRFELRCKNEPIEKPTLIGGLFYWLGSSVVILCRTRGRDRLLSAVTFSDPEISRLKTPVLRSTAKDKVLKSRFPCNSLSLDSEQRSHWQFSPTNAFHSQVRPHQTQSTKNTPMQG